MCSRKSTATDQALQCRRAAQLYQSHGMKPWPQKKIPSAYKLHLYYLESRILILILWARLAAEHLLVLVSILSFESTQLTLSTESFKRKIQETGKPSTDFNTEAFLHIQGCKPLGPKSPEQSFRLPPRL